MGQQTCAEPLSCSVTVVLSRTANIARLPEAWPHRTCSVRGDAEASAAAGPNDLRAGAGLAGHSGPQGEYIVVLEDTQDVHNVIVCTQCSCIAWRDSTLRRAVTGRNRAFQLTLFRH
jgi:hypothetical protein